MMFLSKYVLSHRDCFKLRATDSYSMHRIVLDLFPPDSGMGSRILYVDKGFRQGFRTILVLSGRQPVVSDFGSVTTRKIPEQFFDFSSYRFEIVVNPTRRINSTGKRAPLRNRREIEAWFHSKAANCGFNVSHLETHEIWADQFRKKAEVTVTLGKARFTGVLEVTDRERFKTAFASGLGTGKAFGCGLLQLEPAG